MERGQQNAHRALEQSHLRDHMGEVEEQLGRSGAVVYLFWVAIWVVALAALAVITSLGGRVGF